MSKSAQNSLVMMCAVGAVSFAPTIADAAFNLTVSFPDSTLSPSQQAVFTQAETFWESFLTDYVSGAQAKPSGLTISATGPYIDGPSGTLGSAGPTVGTTRNGFLYATQGVMQFDSADLDVMEANNTLLEVIKHEMGHVIGFGTLWDLNGLYVDGTGQYTGANALALYKTEFNQPTATFVPVELGGGPGTANGHWNEVDGGAGLTGIVDSFGRDMRGELMTGWIGGATFVSQTTLGSFRDLGYVVAIPEPTCLALMGVGALTLLARRRRSA